jgi:CYTH domain-containing protein
VGVEIERKFLVDAEKWSKVLPNKTITIKQGYLSKENNPVVRVRIADEVGYLTLKGKTEGITRKEFEYTIPKTEAEELIALFCPKFIHKLRHELKVGNHTWVIDEFITPRKGLLLAEVELTNENEEIPLPDWITHEVSDDPSYFNSNML